jgi:hypothetical protein
LGGGKRERRRASVRVRAKPSLPGRVVEVALVALLVAALVALPSLAGALPPYPPRGLRRKRAPGGKKPKIPGGVAPAFSA